MLEQLNLLTEQETITEILRVKQVVMERKENPHYFYLLHLLYAIMKTNSHFDLLQLI